MTIVTPTTYSPGLERRPSMSVPSVPPGERNRDQPGLAGRFARSLRKYAMIVRVSLSEWLAYRGDLLLSWIVELMSIGTSILLWEAIYEGAGQAPLSGFDRREMIAYLLLIHVGRIFGRAPGLALRFARDIRDGTFKNYLLQPIDMLAYHLSYWAAHRLACIMIWFVPYGVLFFLCRDYFAGFPGPLTLAAYVAASLLGFLVSFFFDASLGMLGFWFLEVTGFIYVAYAVNYFVSGQMLPLDLWPPFWSAAFKMLPFQYTAYFPAMVFLGRVQGKELAYGLLVELAWAMAFIGLSRWLYRRGLQRYSAYGG